MFLRPLLAALVDVSSPLASEPSVTPVEQGQSIPKLVCPMIGGYSAGSAVRIGPNLLISAKHVTNVHTCMIDNRKIKVIYTSPNSDWSLFTDSVPGRSFRVDCNGFVAGKHYLAIGHARGLDQLTGVELIATGHKDGDWSILTGIFTVIPGQSGGAVIDMETGALVGIVNIYDMVHGISGSIALKDTSVCSKS